MKIENMRIVADIDDSPNGTGPTKATVVFIIDFDEGWGRADYEYMIRVLCNAIQKATDE